jgi:hypothetical protein
MLCAFLVAAGGLPAARAQDVPKLESLTVAVWPEYDRPAALVSYRVQLAPETPLPARIPLPMPTSAGAPHAVAKRGPDGLLYLAQAVRDVHGEWATVTVTTDSPAVQLEYYAEISITGHMREFSFAWPGGLDIANLSYEVLEPTGASEFVVTPPPSIQGREGSGFVTHRADLGPHSPVQQAEIAIAYHKESRELSMAPSQAAPTPTRPSMPPTPPPEPAPPPESSDSNQLLILAFGVAAIVLAGLWVARRWTTPTDPEPPADERD